MESRSSNTERWLEQAAEKVAEEIPAELIRAHAAQHGPSYHSGTNRMRSMVRVSRKSTAVFAAMHWTLLEFHSDVIATPDHPVVPWPLVIGPRRGRSPGQ
jgi:hypothetical protein